MGSAREYWNDFVLEAYVNHRADAIYLAGLPTFQRAVLIPRFPRGMAGKALISSTNGKQ
jgi:hypothetical protein